MSMVKVIRLWEDSDGIEKRYNDIKPVRIEFNYKTDWCCFTIEELKQILRLWIKGEEMVYPQTENCKGRWLLFKEIEKVFNE